MSGKIPLVLLPGVLLRQDLWRDQLAGLTDIADPVVYTDHADHDDLGRIADAILAKAPPRFALAGLSMGGYVAFEIMRRAHERVLKLALLDTAAQADTPEMAALRRQRIEQSGQGEFVGMSRRLIGEWVHPARAKDTELLERVQVMARETGRDGFVNQYTAVGRRPDSRPDLPHYRIPAVVIVGAEDGVTPLSVAAEMASLIPRARLVPIAECGHLSPMERPDDVTAAMRDWLVAD